ncbi:phage capsid protein [Streptomyces sp. NPDC020965]|uniref:phage capsid protein n=1 Tax=Streptomyces sp. NPDC020965 TaxID=3365105 RepID=UPI0037BBF0A4
MQSAGYSVQTFGLGDHVAAVTATEVKAREHRSMTTRGKKVRYWSPPVVDMLLVMLLLDQQYFRPRIVPERPRITFGDTVSEDTSSLAQTLSLLQQAQAVSVLTKVRMLHPEWSSTSVQEEADRILLESGATVPDPMQAGTLM